MFELWLEFIRDIWSKFRLRFVLLLALMLMSGVMDGIGLALLLPLLTLILLGQQDSSSLSSFLDRAFGFLGITPDIGFLLVLIIVIFLVQNMVFLMQSWLAARMQNNYTALWSTGLFDKYMTAKWPFFVKNRAGTLVNTLIGESQRLGGAFYLNSQIFGSILVTFIYVGLAVYVSWQITLSIVVMSFVIFLAIWGFVKQGYGIGQKISSYGNDLQAAANEFIGGAKSIKATLTEKKVILKFSRIVGGLKGFYVGASFYPNVVKAIFEFSAIALLCAILYFGTQYWGINTAVILVITAVFVKLIPRLYSLQQNFQLLWVYLPAIRSAKCHMDMAESYEEQLGEEPRSGTVFDRVANIEIDNVRFSYGDSIILSDVSMTFPAKKVTGIVGSSGAGKSTLVDCVMRFVDPNGGVIRINGRPLEEMPLVSLRRSVGYVAQETFLFHDSIRNNILWGADHLKEEDLITATKKAFVHDFIMSLPEKYETIVGDRGVRLSGGQKQRIGLARALVNDPAMLILDEATSALDSESELYVLRALENLRGEMTIVVIAHRFSTVKNADYIYVLEGGRVVEEGSWSSLLNTKGRFSYLWDLQRGK